VVLNLESIRFTLGGKGDYFGLYALTGQHKSPVHDFLPVGSRDDACWLFHGGGIHGTKSDGSRIQVSMQLFTDALHDP
jgi:hypothetical protein